MLTKNKGIFIYLLLILGIFSVYGQATNFKFLNYDDYLYVTDNPHVRAGLTIKELKWALTDTSTTGNWHPLTWISHMLDCQLFGMNPGKHHSTSVLFHTANSLLLFIVLRKMTGKLWQSGFAAVFFALHPLHVESVAWISERKDVLSAFFWMCTMLSYLWYVNHPEIKRYLLTLFLFILGLMAKSMVITLPFVLLLIDYWPLCRFRMKKEEDTVNNVRKKFLTTTLVFEKIPFLLISAVAGLVAVFSQHSGNAIAPLSKFPIGMRITNALVSYSTYIEKTIWPHDLAFFYPYQKITEEWKVAAACLVLGLISFLSIKTIKRYPFFFVGWWWYIGTLIPVIGLVQIGMQARADRYTYIPLIGLFIIISWGFSLFGAEGRVRKIMFSLIPLVVILSLTKTTWSQIKTWQNSIALSRHAINVTKNNFVAHDILADALVEHHQSEEAMQHYQEALKINPRYSDGYYNLANLFLKQNNLNEAAKNYYSALSYNPTMKEAHNNLGVVLARQGNLKEAIIHFQEALKIKPNDLGAMKNFKKALTMLEVNKNQKK
jgi:Tfp pilus assembly protein PilF